ncbi:MAG: ribonucleoside-diphosphate reductase, partial [Methylococcales bacterium]|nr:ribonucleoside-diphosphate reductase [Methylococcales bacterium]
GPLSFMDIFDKMCFTVSSAGGRRGAQMGTFDVRHPDVLEFIKAKREDGRLRQFNLSLLVTEDFIQAVKADEQWQLAFPIRQKELDDGEIDLDNPDQIVWRDWPSHVSVVINDGGLVACRIYRTMPARRLWDLIMASTYDFAEPGFILIDKVNEMNNNWFDETIRATNPCVTADTWVQTDTGPQLVGDLINQPFCARVDGVDHNSGEQGFFKTATKPVFNLRTREGHSLRLTEDHKVRRVTCFTRYSTNTEWCTAGELNKGDRVLLNNHRSGSTWAGNGSNGEGYLLGLLVGDGVIKKDKTVLSVRVEGTAVANSDLSPDYRPVVNGAHAVTAEVLEHASVMPHRADFSGWMKVASRNEYRLSLKSIESRAQSFNLTHGNKTVTPAIEASSSDFHCGFLRG